jgi:phosphoglycolate phosphatase-like HAD superfamily hydrolase
VKLLVLDFDGVISDSAREAFRVALDTYRALRPASRVGAESGRFFLEAMPLGNRAEDYGAILAAFEASAPLPDQAAYDAFKEQLDAAWLRSFHRRFYEVRAALAQADPRAWLALMPAYPEVVRVLRARAGQLELAIATQKDRASVRRLLQAYDLADLFAEDRVLDKQTGVSKAAHLEHLHDRLGVAYPEIAFVDDKLNHLEAVSPLGVRCVLAAWGYNGPREQRGARERGFDVCTPAELDALMGEAAPPRAPRRRSRAPGRGRGP